MLLRNADPRVHQPPLRRVLHELLKGGDQALVTETPKLLTDTKLETKLALEDLDVADTSPETRSAFLGGDRARRPR